ncbi:initiation factor 2 [Fragilariopsis cylindrus CCMP1102]|uniref:Translation initiation factor IF-2, chloroplastic n=1 Tax=Fragilariopsis cylindrus CCMP1102 TaxID=635003 RepID=A0A1E7FQT3_9STRA|nr:initiation factor 2 [Fragilariopsis cylindrus CCMP1102]|eukprot:OEU20516.1 initiation factor 2 [Fragilariopsis cylindrus CCMP1102]
MMEMAAVVVMVVVVVAVMDVVVAVVAVAEILIQLPRAEDLVLQVLEVQAVAEIMLKGPISVGNLAEIIDEKPVAIIKYLMTDLGVMASMTQNLDPATCVAVVEGFGKIIGGDDDEDDEDYDDDDDDDEYDDDSALEMGFVVEEDDDDLMKPRPPVVTIMGHVDHGKTSLLDAIRNTRVTAGEAGGITQHIAAYQVDHKGQSITFIDTPGHAAFTDMRERGANITDIVILVVAADDGVKQQTADSIVCARQAGVPLVVAINKIDLEASDPNKVMTELTQYDILTEDLGGDVLTSQISAKEGTNLDDLLNKIMLQAEIQDLKANYDRNAEAFVVEAKVEVGLGTVATSLVKKGTLKIGDIFAAGETYGKVRTLISTDGKTRLKEVGPSTPVRIVGFEGIPAAGDSLIVVDDEQTARTLAESRKRITREKSSNLYQTGLMESVSLSFGAQRESRYLYVVVKADVQGSAEALTASLSKLKLENEEATVTVKVLVSDAGEVSKSDMAIASVTPGTTVIAFNVAASMAAMDDARNQNIPLEYYNIVYDAIESVESRMQEVLSPTPAGEYTGSATVQEVFNIGGTGNIAGSRCEDGILRKGANVRVMRGDKILIESTIKTLRNFKSETDSIEAGNECGIGLTTFEEFKADDVIECYVE